MEKLKIGLVGFVHPNMPGDDQGAYLRAIDIMEQEKVDKDFELLIIPKAIGSEEDSRHAVKRLNEENVDFTMFFFASFAYGKTAIPFTKLKSYIGLWSVEEPQLSGVLPLNSFCGTNMFAGIIDHYLREYEMPYKWFYGWPDNKMFRERFDVTVRVMKGLKGLKQTRIGCIGFLADGFENMHFDEQKIGKLFGTDINRRHTVEDIVAMAKSYSDSHVKNRLNRILEEGTWNKNRVSEEHMNRFARINLAFEDFANKNNYTALAISCWSKLQELYDIAPCAAMGRLNEKGIVAPCEGDVAGAITMLLANAFNQQKSTIMDLVAFDEKDQSMNLWHCGPSPRSFANKKGVTWDAHFNIGCYCGNKWCGNGVVTDLTFKPGEVTISRISSRMDEVFVMTGNVMEEKEAYEGSSGWINQLRMKGESISIPDLINTIVAYRVDHHYTAAYGNLENEFIEMANWKKLKVMDKVPYVPYMQNSFSAT